MKQIQISMMFVATILFCEIVVAATTNTNSVITVESAQCHLQPQTGITYRIAGSWICKIDDPGPAEGPNSSAWSLANEFVFRTSLRDSFVLPAASSGQRKEDGPYFVTFERKTGGRELTLVVDPQSATIQMKEDQ